MTTPPPDTRTFYFSPSQWPKGMFALHLGDRPASTAGSGMKDRAAWMLEALNACYSRRTGYCLSPSGAQKFSLLYRAGFWASWRLPVRATTPFTFSLTGGPELPLKEALAQARVILGEPEGTDAPLAG